MLVHGGGPGNGAEMTWHMNIEKLSESYRVIAPDELGYCMTSPPDFDLSLMSRARHVLQFMETLKLERSILVGHSQGGFISSWIALERPSFVSKLISVASGTSAPRGNLDEKGEWAPALKMFYTFRNDESFENFKRVWRACVWREDTMPESFLLKYYNIFMNGLNLQAYRASANTEFKTPQTYLEFQSTFLTRWKSLNVPTMILWGRNDNFALMNRGLELFEMIPGAEIHFLNECKHNVMMDRADSFNKYVLEFAS